MIRILFFIFLGVQLVSWAALLLAIFSHRAPLRDTLVMVWLASGLAAGILGIIQYWPLLWLNVK